MASGFSRTGNDGVTWFTDTQASPALEVDGDSTFLGSAGRVTVEVIPPASLSGTVFADFNGDGEVDFNEQGIGGVLIALSGTDDLGQSVSLSQNTCLNIMSVPA